MNEPLLEVALRGPTDVVLARRRVRELAAEMGYDTLDQTRLATAVSEIARNATAHARGGRVSAEIDAASRGLVIRVRDSGPGIRDLDAVLEGRGRSEAGSGTGIIAARRLVDRFEIETSPGGTSVVLAKSLPADAPLEAAVRERLDRLPAHRATDREELETRNQELLAALDRVERQAAELGTLNRELEDTNRGVVALYAELEERAEYLARANEIKSRFLSHLTHEFRTPLNSILSLTRILLDRLDGELTAEQEKQVSFIRKAGDDLLELVNDLLDLAKLEAGKTTVSASPFNVSELFGALRGMLKPLLGSTSVQLVFEEPAEEILLETDVKKVSQILRNFVSNALKFTEQGEVRVTAREEDGTVVFEVSDTGIGIAEADIEKIFEEFTQLDSSRQRAVKGTGLGLPLSRKLAMLLGGRIDVASRPGEGSVFRVSIPRRYVPPQGTIHGTALDPQRRPVVIVEDRPGNAALYPRLLEGTRFQALVGTGKHAALELIRATSPAAVLLDIADPATDSWDLLSELRAAGTPAPVVVVSVIDNESRARALGANAFHPRPITFGHLRETLESLDRAAAQRILVVDDDEVSRYVLKSALNGACRLREAASGAEGLRRIKEDRPDVLFLDLALGDMTGYEFLETLDADPDLRGVGVVIHTASPVDEVRRRLHRALPILPKQSLATAAAAELVREAMTQARMIREAPHV